MSWMVGLISRVSIVPGKETLSRGGKAVPSCGKHWGGPAWSDGLIASMIRDRRQLVFGQLTAERHCGANGSGIVGGYGCLVIRRGKRHIKTILGRDGRSADERYLSAYLRCLGGSGVSGGFISIWVEKWVWLCVGSVGSHGAKERGGEGTCKVRGKTFLWVFSIKLATSCLACPCVSYFWSIGIVRFIGVRFFGVLRFRCDLCS